MTNVINGSLYTFHRTEVRSGEALKCIKLIALLVQWQYWFIMAKEPMGCGAVCGGVMVWCDGVVWCGIVFLLYTLFYILYSIFSILYSLLVFMTSTSTSTGP